MSMTTIKCHSTPSHPLIFRFPGSRRTRRKQPMSTTQHHRHQKHLSCKDKNVEENTTHRHIHESIKPRETNVDVALKSTGVERRDSVEDDHDDEEVKWRFQTEILRDECNFLRMERDYASKKLETDRIQMVNTLESALRTLVSGRRKISEGENMNTVLEEEIEGLSEKLEMLRMSSSFKENEARKCCDFDEKHGELSDMSCLKEVNEMEVMLDRVEKEYYSVPCSGSTSKRIEQMYQEPTGEVRGEKKCSGKCKAIVRKIVEQVRTETEQWSQMQEMLVQVRVDMEEMRLSRDFYEERAHNSDYEIQSLKHSVEEWKEKSIVYEIKANELQLELSLLKDELRKSKGNQRRNRDIRLNCSNTHIEEKTLKFENAKKEFNNMEETKRDSLPVSLSKQLAKEKRMLLRRLKENRSSGDKSCTNEISKDERRKTFAIGLGVMAGSNRFPFCDIGDTLSFGRENGESSRRRQSFSK